MHDLSTKPAAGLRLTETVRADARETAEILVAKASYSRNCARPE